MFDHAYATILQHDQRLLVLGACLSLIAAVTSLHMLGRSAATRHPSVVRVSAALVFGAGPWSLNFAAMMSFNSIAGTFYNPLPMLTSLLVAALGGATVAMLRPRLRSRTRVVGAGLLLGLALASSLYIATDALVLPVRRVWDWSLIGWSVIAIEVCASLAVLRLGNGRSIWRSFEACLWLTAGILALYLLSAFACTFQHEHVVRQQLKYVMLGSHGLAFAVCGVTLLIMIGALAGLSVEQHLLNRTDKDLRRLRLLGSLSREVMLIHRDGTILEVNSAGERLFGLPLSELLGRRLDSFFDEANVAALRPNARATDPGPAELTVRTATGECVPVEMSCSAIDYQGRPALAMALRDLSDRRRSEERIRHLAQHDTLTGLPNRALLSESLGRALVNAARHGSGLAVMYLDLDRFKPVNDQLGHASGDNLLQQVAARLRAELRPADMLARIGGDEFLIVTDTAHPQAMIAGLAARLTTTLSRPFNVLGAAVEIGGSLGVALYPEDGTTEDALMRAADTALYRVKEAGRGTFQLYDASMDAHVRGRRALEQDLRHALEREQLELHYQPQVNCRTGAVDGFEALVRWHHPERGVIPPLELIPLAEQSGQIARIGEWVLETACRKAASWTTPYWVAVNMSAMQFRQPDLVDRVAKVLTRAGLPPERLEIEVTERVFVEDRTRTMGLVAALRDLGVRISLDDFGGGNSTLSYLRTLTIDKLKIDRGFIRDIGQSMEAGMVVRTIIGLGHDLGLAVVAEGIETPEQLATIRYHGCDHAQGFWLGRPLPHQPGMLAGPEDPEPLEPFPLEQTIQ